MLEGSVATVAVFLKNGVFLIPNFDRIIPGTTAVKAIKLAEKIPLIKEVVRREITVEEAKQNAVEAMFLGGEDCVPILTWDGV